MMTCGIRPPLHAVWNRPEAQAKSQASHGARSSRSNGAHNRAMRGSGLLVSRSRCPWMTANDRRFPRVLARGKPLLLRRTVSEPQPADTGHLGKLSRRYGVTWDMDDWFGRVSRSTEIQYGNREHRRRDDSADRRPHRGHPRLQMPSGTAGTGLHMTSQVLVFCARGGLAGLMRARVRGLAG